jgi:hypothetical protein
MHRVSLRIIRPRRCPRSSMLQLQATSVSAAPLCLVAVPRMSRFHFHLSAVPPSAASPPSASPTAWASGAALTWAEAVRPDAASGSGVENGRLSGALRSSCTGRGKRSGRCGRPRVVSCREARAAMDVGAGCDGVWVVEMMERGRSLGLWARR